METSPSELNALERIDKRRLFRELSISVWIRLLRSYNVISSHIRRRVSKRGLTLPQLYVLATLGVLGDLTLGELGRQILMSKGNITIIVDHLERDGYVLRQRDSEDRRVVWVRLTPEGRQLFAEIVAAYEDEFADLMRHCLSEEELRQLSQLLKRLIEGILRES